MTKWTKQGNLALLWLGSLTLTTVWMTVSRNQRLLDTACKDHGAITQLKLRSSHLHWTFELHCTTNFSCKEALNRPRLPFLPLLLFSSYWLIISTRREISYFREEIQYFPFVVRKCLALIMSYPRCENRVDWLLYQNDGCKNTISN